MRHSWPGIGPPHSRKRVHRQRRAATRILAARWTGIVTSLERKEAVIMSNLLEEVKAIRSLLNQLVKSTIFPHLEEVLIKPYYTTTEVAELSQIYGPIKYAAFTLREACNEGRIPEAFKQSNRNWAIPREAAQKILEVGLGQRKHNNQNRLSA